MMPFDHEDEFEMEQSFADQNGEVAPIDAEQPAIELPLKYLHTTSLVFDLIAHVRSYLFPLVFGLVGAANGNVRLLIISGILFIPAVSTRIVAIPNQRMIRFCCTLIN